MRTIKIKKKFRSQLLQLKNFISKLANKLQRKLLAKQNRFGIYLRKVC